MHLPDISILGLGYLGLPLAQKCYEQGSQVAAVKRNLTSDDINLPIELDIIDLNQDDLFHSSALWQNHINKPTWFCLLPPSSLNHYADTLKKWIQLAEWAVDGARGEITVVIEGGTAAAATAADLVPKALELAEAGMRLKDACKQVAKGTEVSNRELYDAALDARKS